MKDLIQKLKKKKVELFDETGDVLDFRGQSVQNWWDIGQMTIRKVKSEGFLIQDSYSGATHLFSYNDIVEIEGNGIVISVK